MWVFIVSSPIIALLVVKPLTQLISIVIPPLPSLPSYHMSLPIFVQTKSPWVFIIVTDALLGMFGIYPPISSGILKVVPITFSLPLLRNVWLSLPYLGPGVRFSNISLQFWCIASYVWPSSFLFIIFHVTILLMCLLGKVLDFFLVVYF